MYRLGGMNGWTFYTIFISFFLGVFISSVVPISVFTVLTCASLSCGALLAGHFYRNDRWFLLVICAALAFSLGAIRMEASKNGDHPLDGSVGSKALLAGFVCDDPQRKATTQNFCFEPKESRDRVIVTAGRYPEYSYGDSLQVSGALAFPENFEAYAGGPEFDYVSYLAKDGIRYAMLWPKIEKKGEEGNPIIEAIFSLKSALVSQMKNLFPEPESSLLGGLLLGDRSALPKDVAEDFKTVGLVHILVLSGFNVTIVAESLMRLFGFLPRFFGRLLGMVSIILFAIMTGATSTTIRASIMALIVIFVRSSSRRYDVTRALLVAAFLMVVQKPGILAFDVSFQLSFLATVALIYVSPLVSDRIGWMSEQWNLREVLSATIATQIFVFPFLVYAMGQVSLISLLTNMLVLPLIPYAMFSGFMAISAGFVSQALALPVAWLSGLVLAYILKVAAVFAKVPFASLHMKASAFALACIYAAYIFYLIRAWRRRNSSLHSAS